VCVLRVEPSGSGLVTSDDEGIECGSDCVEGYLVSESGPFPSVVLTATPANF
jgi:hypothetical protein